MTELTVMASIEGHDHAEMLDQTPSVTLNGKRLTGPDGTVIAERMPDTWQSQHGRHARILILGEVKVRFEAPAYQYDAEQRFKEVEIVGGTLWSCARELIAFYDAATDRWRDADNQQWIAIRFGASVAANHSASPQLAES